MIKPQVQAPICPEHHLPEWQCSHASEHTTIDGMDVVSGEATDEWAVQTYTPSLARGVSRRSVMTCATQERAEHLAARHRGRGPCYGAWVKDLRDINSHWL